MELSPIKCVAFWIMLHANRSVSFFSLLIRIIPRDPFYVASCNRARAYFTRLSAVRKKNERNKARIEINSQFPNVNEETFITTRQSGLCLMENETKCYYCSTNYCIAEITQFLIFRYRNY